MTDKIKALVSAFAGLFGAIAAIFYGYANLTLIAGLVTFLFTLMVQYSSVKIKVAASIAGILALIATAAPYYHHG